MSKYSNELAAIRRNYWEPVGYEPEPDDLDPEHSVVTLVPWTQVGEHQVCIYANLPCGILEYLVDGETVNEYEGDLFDTFDYDGRDDLISEALEFYEDYLIYGYDCI